MLILYFWLISGVISLFIYFLIKITHHKFVFSLKENTNVTMDNQPQEVGDWQQLSVLGTGAFGSVMLWCNRKKNDFVAIKKCKFQKENALSAKQKERWHLEVEFMMSVKHPNVIGYKKLDPILEDMINKYNPTKLPLLSMEYCKKGNLRRYIMSDPIKLCGLQEHDVRYILEDISNGLEYLHSKNITHRDIKPDNIVLQHCEGRKGETIYKIIDLGYAKELQNSTLSFVGTLHYLAPEIFFNDGYTNSVDYWSMGIMVFEIICGVLPFLPELIPFERYKKIKDKAANDICIYLSYSGAITNSSELRREHFITSCFKQNIEMWLKKALQFDPANRNFSSSFSAFDHIRYILDKKIVKVFSVYKLEFYSYEINDGTLLGTLKDWISRDIKVSKNDFILLFHNTNQDTKEKVPAISYHNNDNALVEPLLFNEDAIIYVYKKDILVSDKLIPKVPNLVKELFNSKSTFQPKFAIQLYRQSLFYVYSDLIAVSTFKEAYISFIQHTEDLCNNIKNKYIIATEKLKLIFINIEEFLEKKRNNNLKCHNNNLDLSASKQITECYKYFERLLSNVERRELNLKDFGRQYRVLRIKRKAIAEAREEISSIFDECDIKSQYDRINSKAFLEKQNGETNDVILKRLTEVISQTSKLKYNLLFKNERLKNYSKDFCYLLKSADQLLWWVDDFVGSVGELLEDFVVLDYRYESIISEVLKNGKKDFILSCNQEDSQQIIKENKLLRCQFEDILSHSVLAHKDYVEESGALFK